MLSSLLIKRWELFYCSFSPAGKEFTMKNTEKYKRQYFMPPEPCFDWVKKEYIDKAPIWCSVDLRDGNQALITPMSLEEKIRFWECLVKIGFKEIEIGFPAASETELYFCRTLIERGLIPEDVSIQVLTQAREHIIAKTFEAIRGSKNAVVHLYNSTSVAQREQVFKKSRDEIRDLAVEGARLCRQYREKTGIDCRFEYSPESFTGTEPEFALEVCNAVLDVWQPQGEEKVIINLPVTVELSMPHVYASQIEYICKHIKYRDNVTISLHPHNDRGCGAADTEMGLLAGADRVEGTLFGNGERTGNVDIVTLAMNMFAHGVDPKLDFEDIPSIAETYEGLTHMRVYERQPYSGSLVFAAFSGSHQDAIAKGMKWREEHNDKYWNMPYLAIDPKDVGREYEGDVIRINSQSGKGGIGYIMETNYGVHMPPKMREAFGYMVKDISDHEHKELQPKEVYAIFKDSFVNRTDFFRVSEAHFAQKDGITANVGIVYNGRLINRESTGNGRLDAVSNALKDGLKIEYTLLTYEEHALEFGTTAKAAAYVGIKTDRGVFWGAGVHNDIIDASVYALVSAINNSGLVM